MRYSQIQTSICQFALKFLSWRYTQNNYGGGKVNYLKKCTMNKAENKWSFSTAEKKSG